MAAGQSLRRAQVVLCAALLLGSLLGVAAVWHQSAAQSFGAVDGLPDPALDRRPASIAGVNVALQQYANLEPVFSWLKPFPWLRQTFAWDQIEPLAGQYDWQTSDRIIQAATEHGHSLIAVLGRSPDWARAPGGDATAPPSSAATFAYFAGAFAARYGADIDVYQIWDEPNILLGWGGEAPSAAAYAELLQAAYTAIHAADPAATVVAAALAPTTETGPDNLSDLLYLQQLYDLGAGPYFDAAAGKPYGFYSGPDDRQAEPELLNFSRFALLRQVMVRNGDGHKLLWGGNFGWNTQASPWGQATATEQAAGTFGALDRAETEWAWSGVMALENLQPAAPPDDPRWGFALVDATGQPSPLLDALTARYMDPQPAIPGNYSAAHPAAIYSGAWKFSDLGADIPEEFSGARLTIHFRGTDFALAVRRADYRGYLYVTIDGQPANRLPRDARGAYVVLTSSEASVPQVVRVPVAAGLDPDEIHTAVVEPERGWGQWALAGFSVGRRTPAGTARLWLALLASAAAISAASAWCLGRGLQWGRAAGLRVAWARLGSLGQAAVTATAGGLLYLTAWLTWGSEVMSVSRRFGDGLPITLTALSAGLFYFSPSLLVGLVALAVLLLLFYLRLDLGLAFVVLVTPLYLQYRLLWQRGFALVEVFTLLVFIAWLAHGVRPLLTVLAARGGARRAAAPWWRRLSLSDWGVAAYLLVATLSLLSAELKGVALREYRLVMLEPVVFYLVLRTTPLDRRALWRIVDFLVAGAVYVALVGLYQYITKTDLITAEGGVARIRSVYGSPNNLALFLGRVLPLAVSTLVFAGQSIRRWIYGAAAALLGLTILLTFSKGALLLGVPAAMAVIVVVRWGRRGWLVVGGLLAAGVVTLPLLARVPRFADVLDFTSGTSFFRVQLWVSAWRMWLDHPWLGVGPDNFLQMYRSRYILPEAWQEPNLSHPHNIVLDFLSRLGLLGFAAGVAMLLGFWQTAIRSYRRLCDMGALERGNLALLPLVVGFIGVVADMVAHGLVDHSFFLVDLAYVFFLALAAVQHVDRLAARPEPVPAPAAAAALRV
jgi:O-antigen ligase